MINLINLSLQKIVIIVKSTYIVHQQEDNTPLNQVTNITDKFYQRLLLLYLSRLNNKKVFKIGGNPQNWQQDNFIGRQQNKMYRFLPHSLSHWKIFSLDFLDFKYQSDIVMLALHYYTFTRMKIKLCYSFKGHLFYMQRGKKSSLT